MQLIVGTDSTWSLRAWLCAKIADIDVSVKVVDLTKPDYRQQLALLSPTGLVPALKAENLLVHDSLAITEYFNELADGALFPASRAQRAYARSLCSELHAGFFNLRSLCGFTLEPVAPVDRNTPQLRPEIERVEAIFDAAELPFMFDKPTAVDAFYAVLAYRLNSYGIRLTGKAGEYQLSLLNWGLMTDGIEQMRNWKG